MAKMTKVNQVNSVINFLKFNQKSNKHQISKGTGINWETAGTTLDLLESIDYATYEIIKGKKVYTIEESPQVWKKRNEIHVNTIRLLENKVEVLKEIIRDGELRQYKGKKKLKEAKE